MLDPAPLHVVVRKGCREQDGSRPQVALRRYLAERRVDGRVGKEEDDGWI